MQETWVLYLGQEDSWKENGNPLQYPSIVPGEFHGQRSLAGYSPWSCKVSDMTGRLTYYTHARDRGEESSVLRH